MWIYVGFKNISDLRVFSCQVWQYYKKNLSQVSFFGHEKMDPRPGADQHGNSDPDSYQILPTYRIRYTGWSFDLFLFRSSGKEDRRPQDEEK